MSSLGFPIINYFGQNDESLGIIYLSCFAAFFAIIILYITYASVNESSTNEVKETYPSMSKLVLSILKNWAGDIKILPIVSSNSKSASRIIIRARKSAKGDTKLLNPLFLYKDEKKIGQKKQYTSEIHNILRNGYGLNF